MTFQGLLRLVEQSPGFSRRTMTDALAELVHRKLEKLEAPVETFCRPKIGHRRIKRQQFAANLKVLAGCSAVGRQAYPSLEVPACRAIIAQSELRFSETVPGIRVCRVVTQNFAEYISSPCGRIGQQEKAPHAHLCLRIARSLILNGK